MQVNNNIILIPRTETNHNSRTQKRFSTANLHRTKYDLFIKNNAIKNASLISNLNFGSAKSRIIETRLTNVIKKYSTGENPLILGFNKNSIKRMAKAISRSDNPLIIGVTGQSACGKTRILNNIETEINKKQSKMNVLSKLLGDNYYKDTTELQRKAGGGVDELLASGYSFDDPNSVDLKSFKIALNKLSKGQTVLIPEYTFGAGTSTLHKTPIQPSKVVIVDSLFVLRPEIIKAFDVKIYVDCSQETIKKRWFNRAPERNIFGIQAENQFKDVTQKANKFLIPLKPKADLILNGEAQENDAKNLAVDLLRLMHN